MKSDELALGNGKQHRSNLVLTLRIFAFRHGGEKLSGVDRLKQSDDFFYTPPDAGSLANEAAGELEDVTGHASPRSRSVHSACPNRGSCL